MPLETMGTTTTQPISVLSCTPPSHPILLCRLHKLSLYPTLFTLTRRHHHSHHDPRNYNHHHFNHHYYHTSSPSHTIIIIFIIIIITITHHHTPSPQHTITIIITTIIVSQCYYSYKIQALPCTALDSNNLSMIYIL